MKYFLLLLIMYLTCLLEAHAEEYVYVSYAVDDSYYSGKDTYTIDMYRGSRMPIMASSGLSCAKTAQNSTALFQAASFSPFQKKEFLRGKHGMPKDRYSQ